MPSHLNAHAGSRQLCEDLFASLQSKIPDLQLARAKDTCGFYQLNHNRFAYVYHRTDSFHIRVYFRGIDSARPIDPTGTLDIHVRPKVEKGWDKEFPYFVNVEQRSQVESAANVLFSFAFPLAKRKGKGKYSTVPTPIATDKSEALPGRVETTNYRILRDTEFPCVQKIGKNPCHRLLHSMGFRANETGHKERTINGVGSSPYIRFLHPGPDSTEQS